MRVHPNRPILLILVGYKVEVGGIASTCLKLGNVHYTNRARFRLEAIYLTYRLATYNQLRTPRYAVIDTPSDRE